MLVGESRLGDSTQKALDVSGICKKSDKNENNIYALTFDDLVIIKLSNAR